MQDVVVVGGGPAGCRCAKLLSARHDVTVIEEHSISGNPVQCTGLVSQETIDLSGVKPNILNGFYGGCFKFPNGKSISVRGKKKKAFLIDRGDFDRQLAYSAMDAGAKIVYGSRYESHCASGETVSVNYGGGKISSRLLIGADGYNSRVSASVPGNAPTEYVRGIQYDVKYEMDNQELIEISVGNEIAPGFFAWKIPLGEITRVGLCTSWNRGPPMDYLKSFMRKENLSDCKVVFKSSGKIPLGKVGKSYSDNLLLVGDAACQVKPLSGGGLYPAMVACNCLAHTAEKAFERNDFSSKFLSSYEKAWKEKIGKMLERDYRIRKYFVKVTDEELNDIFEKVANEKRMDIYENGDIDNVGDVLKTVLSDVPLVVKSLPMIFKVRFRR